VSSESDGVAENAGVENAGVESAGGDCSEYLKQRIYKRPTPILSKARPAI